MTDKVKAAIILFFYGTIDDGTVPLSAVLIGQEDEILAVKDGRSVVNLSEIFSRIPGGKKRNEKDLSGLVCILRQSFTD